MENLRFLPSGSNAVDENFRRIARLLHGNLDYQNFNPAFLGGRNYNQVSSGSHTHSGMKTVFTQTSVQSGDTLSNVGEGFFATNAAGMLDSPPLAAGDLIRVTGHFLFNTINTPGPLTMAVWLTGAGVALKALLFWGPFNWAVGRTNAPLTLCADIVPITLGAVGTAEVHGWRTLADVNPAVGAPVISGSQAGLVTGIDWTQGPGLQFEVNVMTPDPGNSVTQRMLIVERGNVGLV